MMIEEIKKELKKLVDPVEAQKRIEWERKYNEPSVMYGIPAQPVRGISCKYYQKVKKEDKKRILEYCNMLLEQGIVELRTIAFDWAYRIRKEFAIDDFILFETWLKKYVHGWGGCDDLCTHALGAFIHRFPLFLPKVKLWAKSENRWMRRASAVVLIYSVRKKQSLKEVFEVADSLLTDEDVMVQKGYGWMLKEASNKYPHEVFEYVMKHKRDMSRTALRYAIEKLPSQSRRQAMK